MWNHNLSRAIDPVYDMPTIPIGDARVPKIGLGTWRLAGDEARRTVTEALDMGYRHIDTAQMYDNEAEVGGAIMASGVPRHQVFLTTKVWRDSLAREDLIDSVWRSLDRLGTGYVDLLLIHWPNDAIPLDESLDAMQEVVAQGAARQIGVSNFPVVWLRAACDQTTVACNQVECHPFLRQELLREEAQRQGVMITAYCPLARGAVADDPVLAAIGRRHGKSPAQVALRWLIQQPRLAAIPKASSAEHLAANLDLFDFELDDDECRRIAALPQERCIDPDFAPTWD